MNGTLAAFSEDELRAELERRKAAGCAALLARYSDYDAKDLICAKSKPAWAYRDACERVDANLKSFRGSVEEIDAERERVDELKDSLAEARHYLDWRYQWR